MNTPNVLIVEDDRELREALCTTLQLAGMKYFEADCAENALVALEKRNFDIVVSDVNMPGMSGHELLAQVKSKVPGLPMMLITAFGQIKDAVDAMQAGADDYLVKPFEPQTLIESIERIVGGNQNTEISDEPVASSAFTKEFFKVARKVAKTESTVMISGESGTGKEVLARYIHRHSPRKNKPFVAINCAAIPENMLEAMLFGHEKGAFTGAYNSSPGKFEQANGGTLLLDEVSEMDLGLQAKLLRVLQEREVERVGGKRPIKLDVRVLATTNRALKSYVDAGKFREDLFYRLSVFPMAWKPLRERRDDILPIAERLLQVHATKMRRGAMTLDTQSKQHLVNYPWPGNVRELDNAIQRSLILAEGSVIESSDLILEMPESTVSDNSLTVRPDADEVLFVETEPAAHQRSEGEDSPQSLSVHIDSSALNKDLKLREFQIIIDTLREEGGKKKQTAERLGISPRTLRYKLAQMREVGIDVASEIAA
ncbi:sigma-54-dependent Fis family transcriptional regulator [Oleiphilus sp. HI0118]|nr:sigma-54-dependent Fis family transcriptional regulator [Oleiphilus sp. HI0118]